MNRGQDVVQDWITHQSVRNCSPQLRCGIANDVSDSYALQIDGIPEKIATSKKEFVENWLMQFLSTKS